MQNVINTILVAIDFTEKSYNAVKMAAHMAVRHNAKVILFHSIAHHAIIDRTGRQVIGAETISENHEKAEQTLNKLENSLKTEYSGINFQTLIKNGSLVNGINEAVESEDVDLVICGSSGKQNLTQVILGSLSYEILTGTNCSVLLVPENCTKYVFEKILVPIRVLEDLTDKIDLSVRIAKKNNALISLLAISNEEDFVKIRKAYQRAKTNLAIKSQEYNSKFLLTHDKATHISKFSQEHHADIIILNYKDEGSWRSFFAGNFFKQIINYTDIPLLFLKKRVKSVNRTNDNLGFDITLPHPG